MKGIFFNYLEEYVTDTQSIEAWEKLLDECPMKSDKVFIGPGSYPDTDFLAILNFTAKKLNLDPERFLNEFGYYTFRYLARDYPLFLQEHSHPKTFLKTVDGLIHVEVRKLFKEATPPHFEYEDPSPSMLIIKYYSHRKMCHLMEGIIRGVSEYYNTPIKFSQKACMHKGDKMCLFELKF